MPLAVWYKRTLSLTVCTEGEGSGPMNEGITFLRRGVEAADQGTMVIVAQDGGNRSFWSRHEALGREPGPPVRPIGSLETDLRRKP